MRPASDPFSAKKNRPATELSVAATIGHNTEVFCAQCNNKDARFFGCLKSCLETVKCGTDTNTLDSQGKLMADQKLNVAANLLLEGMTSVVETAVCKGSLTIMKA
ncbi:unnamed protein product [Ceratitis capitata]|uniref:(Mediterranean fruit fly) hypothetical protein n=1 Tax=Ceratitis capitata TaxID=7213 RepID=A0A811UUL5_CERCA|nr:unnamed protein product [Ceratitis capitata]